MAGDGGAPGAGTQVREGQPVVDANGVELGTVKEVRGDDFLLARMMEADVYVPLRDVAEVTGGRVVLTLLTNDVSSLNLETP